MASQNPNWPRLQALWSPGGHIGYGPSAASYELLPWVDVTPRLIGPWQINRGRQYELDQVTAGTWSGVLDNRDGLFDPGNVGSAVGGRVVPYQPFRIRAQWPVTTNLLTDEQATCGEASGLAEGAAGDAFGVASDLYRVQVATSGTAWQGTRVWQISTLMSFAGVVLLTYGPIPLPAESAGKAFAFSVRIRCVSDGANPTVTPFLRWLDIFGNTVSTVTVAPVALTGSESGAWTFAGVPGTAPAAAVCAVFGLTLTTVPAAEQWDLQADGAQFEQNSTATAFGVPGRWYPLFTGGIERYPQTWRQQGTLGTVQAVAVDALALLSQSKLFDPFATAVFHHPDAPPPAFAYLLSDSSGGLFLDSTGSRDPAQIAVSPEGPGTITAGVTRAAADPAGLFVCPAGTTVVNISSTAATGVGDYDLPRNLSFIKVPPARSGISGPGADGTGFTRMIAFRVLAAPKVQSAIWMATGGDAAGTFIGVGLWVNPDLTVSAVLMDANRQDTAGTRNLGAVDIGNWHLAFISMTADGAEWGGWLDYGAFASTVNPPFTGPVGGFTQDLIGASAWPRGYAGLQYNFSGDVALAVEWAGELSFEQMEAISTAWKTGWTGEAAWIRFGRILHAAGWSGPVDYDSDTVSLAAATDIDGTDAASALQAVTDTEGGVMYVDAAGTIRLIKRSARWNPAPAAVVFGEDTGAGEWPIADAPVFDFDPTLVTNLAEVTQYPTNLVLTAQDFTSQRLNGVRERQVTSQSTDMQECQDKASWLVFRYRTPHTRVASLTAHPAAMPALWPAVLGLDLGSRAKAIRRPPPPAAPVVVDGFVENIAWSVDVTGEATLTVQISPADPAVYGFVDSAVFDHFVFGY